MRRYIIILMLLVFGRVSAQEAVDLLCEQRANPEGIDVVQPRLSWQLSGDQTAWQVIVASSEEKLAKGVGDLWNSGKVGNDESVLVGYAGVPLKSRMVCYWKVKVWTNAREGGWSKPAYWSMGLLQAADWKGKWIGYEQGFPWDSVSKFSRLSARYFRKNFDVRGIRQARLYVAGPGHYEVAINGKAIGDQVLAQAPTDYTKSVSYNTYDVTKECSDGKNVLDVVLGNGRFFTMRPKYKPKKIKEFGFPKLLLQLEITDDKGRRTIVSDTSWRFTADGPIRSNNEYDGEEYDARKELGGWMKPQMVAAPGGRLVAQMNPPIKVMTTIKPVGIKEGKPGVWILDMGQNMAGWVQMSVRGSRGEQVTLRYAETLQKNGELYTANLRDAKVTDIYTLKGEGQEVWHPVFVFHGFRYVEVSGYPGRPGFGDFEGQVVYDDLANVGEFHSSDTILNQLFRNAWWGINSNYKGMPVDCPQRNERMPWLGDRATGSLGESYLFNNGLLYAKWLEDIEESQKADGQLPDVAPAYWNYYSDNMTWPGVYILIADMLYNQYGDVRPIRRHYASMKKWLRYMSGKYEKDGIITKDKYGDWCVPPESPELIHSKDSSRNTDGQLIATAYYYHLLGLMGHFSELLHVSADAAEFAGEGEKVRTAFNKKFFVEDHYSNNTVTANLLPLYFGMVPDAKTEVVFKHITDKIESNGGQISTGVIGTQWLMRGLTRYGRADLAYRIASNTDYPSWGYMVEHGATTIWELWNGDSADPAMNSQNHIMLLGDLLTWMFQDLAGIAPAAPGFKKIRMKPVFPAGLDFAEASYQTPYGRVSSSWRRKGGAIIWDVVVPANVRAQVYLPDGKVREIGSGAYHFEANLKL
ncbi:MAG TPA: family 78 glycoside hydrolase catalytic domain [Puia sp.]|nr:family 78 glycoside hydrolase catalytic domain [Puia sp.]